jgi:hypothetical protein
MQGIRTATGIAAALAAGGVLLSLWARQAVDATATSDIAVIESYTMLAARGDLLLGPYSRFQWHHPGPLYFYWLVPFHVLSGVRTSGLNAGAVTLNLLAIGVIAWVLFRRATPVVAVACAAALGLYSWRTLELLTSPWNAHIPVLPMTALVVVAADAMSGTPAMLPLAGMLASLAGQTHVALLPSALAIGVSAVAGVFLPSNRVGKGAGARIALATVAAVALCWAPSIVEQLSTRPGNISLLWSFFMADKHPGPPFSVAVSAWADMLSGVVRPDYYVAQGWIFRESPVRWAEMFVIAQLAALGLVAVRGFRSAQRFETALALLLALVSGAALWSTTKVEGEVFDHGVFWMSGIGALNTALLASLGLGVVVKSPARLAAITKIAPAACGVLVLVASAIGLVGLGRAIAGGALPPVDSQLAGAVAEDLLVYMKDQRLSRPLVKLDQDAWGIAAGVILRLQKSKVPVAVEDDWIVMFTPAFAATGQEPAVLTIAGRAEHVRLVGAPNDAVVVSRDPIYVHRRAP